MLNSKRPKYQSQKMLLKTIDKNFFQVLEKRDLMVLKNMSHFRNEIIACDLKISIYIKKRAQATKGGFNYILEEMWGWRPIFSIDNRLLPKITINLLKSECNSEDSNH
tara:strand:- start:25 stop:348 length:324 start_codon:yes stop_codon:yes gene_type:complete